MKIMQPLANTQLKANITIIAEPTKRAGLGTYRCLGTIDYFASISGKNQVFWGKKSVFS